MEIINDKVVGECGVRLGPHNSRIPSSFTSSVYSVFPSRALRSQVKDRVFCNPDQDKALNEDEQMNEIVKNQEVGEPLSPSVLDSGV